MRLAEFASAQDQLELWRLISDAVWSKLGNPVQPQPLTPSHAPTPVHQPTLPKPQKKGIKPKKPVARKIKIPTPPPPKPLAKPRRLYPAKAKASQLKRLKGKPSPAHQTAQQRAKSAEPSRQISNINIATRGIATMNAPASISNLRSKP